MIWLVIPMVGAALLYTCCVRRRFGSLNVLSIFLWFQIIMAAGSAPLLDPRRSDDVTHAAIMLSCFFVALMVGWALQWRYSEEPASSRRYAPVPALIPGRLFYSLVVASVLVCTAYYMAVGYNVILRALLGDGGVDVAELRFETYSGSRYLFPGYVNQFKNSLLPALSMILVWSAFSLRSRGRWVWAVGLAVVNVLFLLGTGQRGAFVTFVLVCVVFLYYADHRRFAARAIGIALFAIPVFLLSTVALGRADSALEGASSPGQKMLSMAGQIWFRIFDSNQEAAVEGFRYVYPLGSQHGGEWALGVRGLLPGVNGSDLDNRIYEYMYGTDRGTAPLSLWGSAFHNFGVAGALIFSAFIGVVLALISLLVLRWKGVNAMTAIGSAGVTVLFGTWIAGGPLYLINSGLVVYVALWIWGKSVSREGLHSSVLLSSTAPPGVLASSDLGRTVA